MLFNIIPGIFIRYFYYIFVVTVAEELNGSEIIDIDNVELFVEEVTTNNGETAEETINEIVVEAGIVEGMY